MKSTNKANKLTRTDKAWIDGYFEGYESGVQSLHNYCKSEEEIISAWKDKDEFELLPHLRKLARFDEKLYPEEAREFDILLSYWIKTGGQEC